jgi:6-phosphogluconate dehydrogenase
MPLVRRLQRAGHHCVVYDTEAKAMQSLTKEGAIGANPLQEFADNLKKPRAVWMMVPAAAVDPTLKTLIPLLERDDIVIDGGNSYCHDDIPCSVAYKFLSALRYQFGGHEGMAAAKKEAA